MADGAPDRPSAAADHNGGRPPEVVRQGRLPRWTRQEILVLIQGKRVAETGTRRGRAAAAGLGIGIGIGTGQIEPKWVSVSSYCRRHGVNRGPVQCRKRWSNLAGDYKKIKEWEGAAAARDGNESFWVMRNDARRERKLPGFFDREVYDILERGAAVEGEGMETREEDSVVVFDSGRSTAAEDGLFSDGEMEVRDGDRDSRMAGGSGGASNREAMAAAVAAAAAPISGNY